MLAASPCRQQVRVAMRTQPVRREARRCAVHEVESLQIVRVPDRLAQPDLATRLNAAGLEPAVSTGDELLQLVRKDIPRFRKLIDDIGIKPE